MDALLCFVQLECMKTIHSHRDLLVYQTAFMAACAVLRLTATFPKTERYELIAQIRKACRSVCANLAEAWRKRVFPASFVAKIVDSESEAAETQVWLEFALADGYITEEQFEELFDQYEKTLSQLVLLRRDAKQWTINTP